MLYFSVFIGGVGMIFGGASYEVKLPAFKGFVTASGDWLWPLLFITVAAVLFQDSILWLLPALRPNS